ncbi:phosphodiester glycosidase family protein [Candidatus Gottesmanbacteria bacterium]|nr:phosphodiester glycosidase family protein [Candidatus Gottesmanbacteria bacterium]
MKKFVLLFVCAVGFVSFLFNRSPRSAPTPQLPSPPISPSPAYNNGLEYFVDNQPFRVVSFIVKDPTTIRLIPNFSQKAASLTVVQTKPCAALTSGGFYSTEGKPIGLFIVEGKQRSSFQTNALFNGFFSVNASGKAIIGNEVPDNASAFALQSGPMLVTDGITRKLVIRNDEPARRIVVVQTSDNSIVFLALYSRENTFEGPKLAEVPKHLIEIEKFLGISITNALNLDGGSASAFITKDASLTELTPVGSFFCIQ